MIIMKFTSRALGSTAKALVGGLALTACGLLALPAVAQQAPPQTGPAPSYATPPQPAPPPSYATTEEHIRGRISSFDGKYTLEVRDDRGFIDNVTLHDGTIINPTGLRLAVGQSVTVLGHNAGKTFEANEIDTPYANYGAAFYGYAPYGYYPYYAYPAFGIGFRDRGFGFRGWF
jgi:hypothetical protein